MKVLFITGDYPHAYDPANGLFNAYLARGLAEDHEVHVICPISWMAARRRKAPNFGLGPSRGGGQNPVHVTHKLYWYPPRIFRSHYGSFLWWSIRGAVRRVLRDFKPDVVLAYWAHPDGEVAVRIARELGVPSGVIIGGSDVLLLTKNAARRRKVVAVLQQTNAVITVNEHLKKKVESFEISAAKIHKWDQGVDEKFTPGSRAEARTRLGIPQTDRVAVWVGRMVPVKALEVLLDAAGRMKQSGSEFALYLVGDGPLRPELDKAVAANGLTGIVRFAGTQLHDRLPDWYRAADITVLPSWSEGLPNVLRESLACGTPFVASRVGGIPEIAGDRADCLVEPGDASALATTMTRMLARPGSLPSTYSVSSWLDSARALIEIFQPRRSSVAIPMAQAS